ncbi:MAG TPA: DUF4242 domain-containing protein [Chryseolinea sp.]|nr:DUF4242 domain-containing protein [Chryseolinea sp.]
MPKFVIERHIPNAGKLTAEQLRAASQKSREVLAKLGSDIQWIHSYVAGDKIYCIYLAPSEELILEHARLAGFPADKITLLSAVIDLSTAD